MTLYLSVANILSTIVLPFIILKREKWNKEKEWKLQEM